MPPIAERARSAASGWADLPLVFKGVVVVALPLVVLSMSLVSLWLASDAESRAEDDVRLTFAIQRDTHQVHALLAEAAAGVRGYLLTGQERFLEPYRKSEAEMPRTLARLDASIRDRAVRVRFERVMALTVRKREGLAGLVELARRDDPGRDAAIAAALTANKRVLDGLRAEIDTIHDLEESLMASRRARVDEVRARYLALTAISGLVGLLGSLAAVYLFSTGIVRRVRLLEGNAELLERGEPLAAFPEETDEIGRLARKLDRASALLRAREQALREGEERFRLVIEGVRDYGIFALSPEGNVASWNTGAERIKGWRADEILGQHFSAFYPEDTRATRPAEVLDRARRDGRTEDEGWRVRKDGTRFWANVVVTALRDEEGRLRGFAKVTRDITERKRTEEALRVAREEAVAASLAKSEFLSRTSHELRTPMGAILGFAQMLELDEEQLGDRQRTAVAQILKAGRHLQSLINDLLDISSIEAGGDDVALEAVDLSDVLREVRELVAPIVGNAGLAFRFEGGPDRLVVRGDRRRIVQVVLNLMSNAAKYGRTGTTVTLAAHRDGAQARVEVSDDGPGVAPADIPRLFTPFDRLGHQRVKGMEGTGLGLALSKRLVEAMGGDMTFRNQTPPARGAVFAFTLPLAAAEIRKGAA
ncbi:MAG: PAS domain S-box protein [Alphaproteobacteria bacterium]|nr:PAS domain S-box protein [Alphaproteobacteria bacterium]